jgi:hypothetical protein
MEEMGEPGEMGKLGKLGEQIFMIEKYVSRSASIVPHKL